MKLTVIIPTHNPRAQPLRRVLDALAAQTLPRQDWELLVIDNASSAPLAEQAASWPLPARVVREDRLGLTHARLRGIAEAAADILVWVDDDNVLASDYLATALMFFLANPAIGAAGGKSVPEYETPPPDWFDASLAPLGCRDLGDDIIVMRWSAKHPAYPEAAPIGAGLVARRQALAEWGRLVAADPMRRRLGRSGQALSSGEDNDICLTLLRAGWELAYLPDLTLTHLLGSGRLTPDYLQRISRASFRDFIKVLNVHGIRPWAPVHPWLLWPRLLRAWLRIRPWSGPVAAIRWQRARGQFEGRRDIHATRTT